MSVVAERDRTWRARVKSAMSSGPDNPVALAATGQGENMLAFGSRQARFTEQYKHNVGWVYTAVARIATRVAGQQAHVGRKLPASASRQLRHWQKQHGFAQVQRAWERSVGTRLLSPLERTKAPAYIKQSSAEYEIVEQHEFLDALNDPNDLMVKSSLLNVTVTSLEFTGRGWWWKERVGGNLRLWYLPADWVTPVHSKEEMYVAFDVQPPSRTGDPIRVPYEDMLMFMLPSPDDPHKATSPVQSQAPAIAADEALQIAQARTFHNDINPGLMIKMARMPGVDGRPGPRPILQRHQRKDIIEALLAMHKQAVNYREPLILDGLIEGVERMTYTPAEMDYLQSGNITKGRIFQAFGVNPFISGENVTVGWGQASVADSTFCDNVVNPMCTFLGEVISKHLGSEYMFWFEQASSRNPELALKKYQAALNSTGGPYVTADEFRQEVLSLPPMDEDEEPEEEGDEDDAPADDEDDGSGQPEDVGEPPKKPVPED